MMKEPIWLVVANTVEASIYQVKSPSDWRLIQTYFHNKSRLKSKELVSDKPGRYLGGPYGQGQFAPSSDAHEEEHAIFAKEIAAFLNQEKKAHRYESLILCIEPHFHGLLEKVLSPAVQARVEQHIFKDYIPLSKAKFHQAIKNILQQKPLKIDPSHA